MLGIQRPLLKTAKRRLIAAFALFCAAFLAVHDASALPPPPNTVISNTAFATWTDAAGGIAHRPSNTVQFSVAWVAAFTLTSAQSRFVPPGAPVSFPHTLVNTGNGTDTFDLSVANNAGGGFDFSSVAIYADANGDGAPDNQVPITSTGPLAPGAAFRFVAVGVVPANAAVGAADSLTVSAVGNAAAATAGGYTAAAAATNLDTATVTGNAVMVVTKTLEVTQGPAPNTNAGQHIRVTLAYRNIGGRAATGFTLTDLVGAPGTPAEGFAYVVGFARWNGTQILTDAALGDPAGIAFDFGVTTTNTATATIASVPPGTGGSVSFLVDVKANLPPGVAMTSNTARFSYFDGAANAGPIATNTASYEVRRAIMQVWKTINVTSGASPTQGITYTLAYRNVGNIAAANLTLADVLPANSSYVANSGAWTRANTVALTDAAGGDPAGIAYDYNAGATRVSAVLASVAPGETGSVSFRADIASGVVPGSVIANSARYCYGDGPNTLPSAACTLGAGASAVAAGTATNEVFFTVIGGGGTDLRIAKVANGGITVNNCGTYTITVTNDGPLPSSGAITVTDTLPAGLVYQPSCVIGAATATSGGTGWTCPAAATGGSFTCTTNAVVPAKVGATPGQHPGALTIVVKADPGAGLPALPAPPGTITLNNTVTVAGGGEPPANAGNNTAIAATVIGPSATVRGTVWRDINHDRIFVAGNTAVDDPLPGWKIEALQGGVIIRTATTDAAGQYAITDLIPGTFQIRFRDPLNNVVNGRPVCNEAGTDSTVQANCEASSLSGNKSQRDVTGEFITVTLTAGDTILRQSLPLDPSGVIYDSITRRPLAGATVEVVPPAGFNPALHLIGGAGNVTQVTSGNGFYQFILTSVGVTFCGAQPGGGCLMELRVTAPAGFLAVPSTLIPASPSAGGCAAPNCIDPTGLGGALGVFSVQPQNVSSAPQVGQGTTYYFRYFLSPGDPDVVNNHIPVDPIAAAGNNLLVQKVANKNVAEIGDFLDYTVRVRNPTAAAVNPVIITDRLPFAFAYVRGSARLAGAPLADPPSAGPVLTFAIGAIASLQTAELTYRVRLGQGATQGDGINRASAGGPGIGSNTASSRVRVTGGVFSDKGYIVGTVFADCNGNGVKDADEAGIPGVRLILEDGAWVVTDNSGRYSLYGLSPRTHALKVDDTTLPAGAQLAASGNRGAGRGGLRFVDIKRGEMHRADFAETGCAEETVAEIEARRKKAVFQAETRGPMERQFPADAAPIVPGDLRGLPASGVIGAQAGQSVDKGVFAPVLRGDEVNAANSNLPRRAAERGPQAVMALAPPPLEQQLEEADNKLAILHPKDGQVMPIAQAYVQVKGVLGAKFRLTVNGSEVPESRVGKRSTLESKQLQGWEYVAVQLKAGENRIEFTQLDGFGNVRGSVAVKVLAPGNLGKVTLEVPASASADTSTPVKVLVKVQDENGVPVTSRTALTLEATHARWAEPDLDPSQPGVQVFVENGQAEFGLIPPQDAGEALLRVSGSGVNAEAKIAFLPNLRPLVGAGVIEGAINLRSLSLRNIVPVRERDGFEQQIRKFSYESGDGKRSAEGRAALYLKGKVKGEYLLTVAYDSDKDLRERLFRDVNPDDFYPVYGDSSVRGYDAQTSGRLYVRVDKGRSYVLYGDYSTASTTPARALTQYNRSLTGVKQHYETGSVSVNAFASRDTFRQVVQEIPANGTSGPYFLANNNQVINSERVEILTRDRAQPSITLKTEPQSRFADYEIETYTGRLLFKAPVPSLDENLNPRMIRVTYELDQGGAAFWVAGVDAQVKLTDNIEVGGVAVRDANPGNEFSLTGINATVKLGEKTSVTAELAHTDTKGEALPGSATGKGGGARIEFKHQDDKLDARVFAGRTDVNFTNAASSLARGREEAGARATYKLDAETSLGAEAVRSVDRVNGGQRDGILLKIERTLGANTKLEVGVRRVSETVAPAFDTSIGATPNEFTSVRAKLTMPVPGLEGASAYVEGEQDIENRDRRLFALGGEYRTADGTRLYGRHELLSSLQSGFGLTPGQRNHTSVFGIDTPYMKDGRAFSEYRIRDAIDARQAEAAVGLRNQFRISETTKLSTSFERIHPFSSAVAGLNTQSTAITGGLEWNDSERYKSSTRLEWRDSEASTSWLQTAAYALRFSNDWTGLARSTYSIVENKVGAGGDITRYRAQAGLAYRDSATNRLGMLSRVEYRRERDTTQPMALKRSLYLASFHANYQPQRDWTVSGRYAGKYVLDDSSGISSRSTGNLFSGRLTYDVNRDWDVGVTGSMATSGGAGAAGQARFGLGLEVGYLLTDNLWLAVGYNFFGFKDRDLQGEDHTDRGWFLRLRYKFDEDLFNPSRTERSPQAGERK